jgi:hypothetical protein
MGQWGSRAEFLTIEDYRATRAAATLPPLQCKRVESRLACLVAYL